MPAVNAQHAGFVLIDLQMHHFVLFVPIEIDVVQIRLRGHQLKDLPGDFTDFRMLFAGHAKHHRIRGGRAGLNDFEMRAHVFEFLGE